jgi:hypothetical protein
MFRDRSDFHQHSVSCDGLLRHICDFVADDLVLDQGFAEGFPNFCVSNRIFQEDAAEAADHSADRMAFRVEVFHNRDKALVFLPD